MAEITPEERVQKVKAHLLEDLEFEPEKVRNFFTSNIFGRVFAHLVGWTGKKALMLRCTAAGEIKTAPTTTGIEHYDRKYGDADDAWPGTVNFESVVSRIDFFIWDNTAELMLIDCLGVGQPIFEIDPGFYSIDYRAQGFKIKNKTAGQTARYQLIGWW